MGIFHDDIKPDQVLDLVEACPREDQYISEHIKVTPVRHVKERHHGRRLTLDPNSENYKLFNSRILYNSLNIELQELAKLRIPLHMLYTRYEAPNKEKIKSRTSEAV